MLKLYNLLYDESNRNGLCVVILVPGVLFVPLFLASPCLGGFVHMCERATESPRSRKKNYLARYSRGFFLLMLVKKKGALACFSAAVFPYHPEPLFLPLAQNAILGTLVGYMHSLFGSRCSH